MDVKKSLIVDVAALVIFLLVANPALTGIGTHEWLALAVIVVFLVHIAMHIDWITKTARSSLTKPTWAHVGNLILDVGILVACAVCTVSGLLVSGAVLPALGLYAEGYYVWDPLHAVSAKVLLALLLVHVVVHGKWLVKTFVKGKDHER